MKKKVSDHINVNEKEKKKDKKIRSPKDSKQNGDQLSINKRVSNIHRQ